MCWSVLMIVLVAIGVSTALSFLTVRIVGQKFWWQHFGQQRWEILVCLLIFITPLALGILVDALLYDWTGTVCSSS